MSGSGTSSGLVTVLGAGEHAWVASAIAFPCLLAFWAFVGWRVRRERAVVSNATALDAFKRAMRELERAIAQELLPVLRRTGEQMAAWADAWKRALAEMRPEDRAVLFAELGVPEGGTLEPDTTPLLERGDPK